MSALARIDHGSEALDVEHAARTLAQCKTVDSARDIRDKAKAVAVYQRTRGASLEAQNDAAEIALRAERRLGELLRDMPKAASGRRGSRRGPVVALSPPSYADQGIDRRDAQRWQQLSAVPQQVFEDHVRSVRKRGRRITTTGLIAALSYLDGYDSDEWTSPPEVVEAARRVLGAIDLDPASHAAAQQTIQADCWWSKADDGLTRPWSGRVWMHPPCSYPLVERFVDHLLSERESGRVTAAVVVVNASTDTAWFQRLADASTLCFPKGRVAFAPRSHADRLASGNRLPQACAYMGPDHERFADVFGVYGLIGCLRGRR